MFEASFIALLVSDSELVDRISTYRGAPAIFVDSVPKKASCRISLPYIVFNIDRREGPGLVIEEFTIDMDIYGLRTKSKVIREIIERIYFLIDLHVIKTDARFSDIRLFRDRAGYVHSGDSSVSNYELLIYARGVRKKWIDQL